MISLYHYIIEGIDSDIDNVLWKLDTWFKRHPEEKSQFKDIIKAYNIPKKPNIDDIIGDLNIEPIIQFVCDDIHPEECDHKYLFTKLLNNIIACKSPNNAYL